MELQEIVRKVSGIVAVDAPGTGATAAYSSDLLSDVMGHCDEGAVLITIQNHVNTIAVCTLVGVEVVVICHARQVPDDMAAAARREGVALVVTPLTQYEVARALAELPPSKK